MKSISLYFVAFSLIMGTQSCTKDDSSFENEQLVGVWYKFTDYADDDQTRTTEWTFTDDGTFEIVYIEFQKSTGEFLGYSVLYRGDFRYSANIITMNNIMGYSYSFIGDEYVENAEYLSDKESFIQRKGIGIDSNRVSISFKKSYKELLVTYIDCNDTENCVGSETLTKK